ncbi:hypothetical protein O7606_21660 [Micromonospora sp. WMMD882]|uniref:hypothetical protein n=1 Tax=Micromonospora sp. WMMD882 TaxID=3015151 RepID=UPI00248B848A|nr:hypothetical protein [Micromonospora sp. WMMD882]WBB78789.1 hypothetical protein O7606_21660 [Micromonospora sp. WMMD882]
MSNFFTPLTVPRAAFEEFVRKVDSAVGKHAIALALHEDFPYRALQVVGDGCDLAVTGLDDAEDLIDNLDQILFFAFEYAPEEVIREWASEHEEDLAGEAVSRVTHLRSGMPNLATLWREKSFAIVPPLTSFRYKLIHDAEGNPTSVIAYMSAGRISISGKPDSSDVTRLRVQLWPSDVQSLIEKLEHLRDDHFGKRAQEGE